MKKSRLLMVMPAAFAMLLAACTPATSSSSSEVPSSSSEPTSSESSSSEESSQPTGPVIEEAVAIEFWHTFNDQYAAVIQNFIEAFKDIEPNVTVSLIKQSSGYDEFKDKVIQGFSADNYPDIGICYPDHVAEYIDYGKAVRLDLDYMQNARWGWSEEDFEDIIPNYLEEGASYTIPGTYSLPFAKSTEAMFYNADVLIGLDLSEVDPTINGGLPLNHDYINNLTWEELFNKLCPAIAEHNASLPEDERYLHDDQQYHGIIGYDSDDNLFITLAQQYGYDYTGIDESTGTGQVLFDNEGMKSLMKTFNQAYKNGYLITKASAGGAYVNETFTKNNLLFSVGSTGGTKYQYTQNFTTGVARIPTAAEGERYVINQGPSLTILDHNDDNRALAAWLFCKFMAEERNTTTWGIETAYMPVRYSSYSSSAYLEYSDPTNAVAEGKLFASVATYNPTVQDDLFTSPVFVGSSTCREQAGSVMYQCLISEDIDSNIDKIFADAVATCLLAL